MPSRARWRGWRRSSRSWAHCRRGWRATIASLRIFAPRAGSLSTRREFFVTIPSSTADEPTRSIGSRPARGGELLEPIGPKGVQAALSRVSEDALHHQAAGHSVLDVRLVLVGVVGRSKDVRVREI